MRLRNARPMLSHPFHACFSWGLLILAALPLHAEPFQEQCRALERKLGGRLGVAVLDTQSGTRLGYRADERFPMCSTFKSLLAGAVLRRVDRGQESLGRRVRYRRNQLVSYSPVTEKAAGDRGLTVGELCTATVTLSDNTAANLLLRSMNGPDGLTAFVRSLGDSVTRLDRYETPLNQGVPGDPRDTTTPQAMVSDWNQLLTGSVLTPGSRQQLAAWLVASRTGNAKLRAGLPADWRVGDKTGMGEHGTTNDVAVFWPPGRSPVIVAVYITGTERRASECLFAFPQIARNVCRELKLFPNSLRSEHSSGTMIRNLPLPARNDWYASRAPKKLEPSNLAQSDAVLVHLEKPGAEDALIAAGMALALQKPTILIAPERKQLPWFLQEADLSYPSQVLVTTGAPEAEAVQALRADNVGAGTQHFDTFIGCLMSGLSKEQYAEGRSHLLNLHETLRERLGSPNNFCEGINVGSSDSFGTPKESLVADLAAVKNAEQCVFYQYDNSSRPSGMWVELGAALAWGKPCTLLAPDLQGVPPAVREGIPHLKVIQYGTHEQMLQRLKSAPETLLAR